MTDARKEYHREYQRKWRKTAKGRAHCRAVYARRYARFEELKTGPCKDCRRKFPPECMDFDHVRGKKSFQLSNYWVRIKFSRVLTEIAKCELVCSNCHRIRTRRRLRERSKAVRKG